MTRWSRCTGRRIGTSAEHLPECTLVVPKALPIDTGTPTIVAAVAGPADLAVASTAAEIAACLDGVLVLAHAVPLSFGERSIGLTAAVDGGRDVLRAAHQTALARAPGLTIVERLLRMWPHELVGGNVDADLLVLGRSPSVAINHLGLIATSAVFHSPCAVLVVPQDVVVGQPH